jgi:MYXO-CTERM domain-containing protein
MSTDLRLGYGLACTIALTLFARASLATEYHVATTGDDAAAGTSAAPFKTIQKAADVLNPGDTCTVHEGTYREWVKPKKGGTSDTARIVYQAAAGETVWIKGSEPVTGWTADQGVYKAVVPNSTFGSFNPYSTNISGGWLSYGKEYHLGGVYLDGAPFLEKLDMATVVATPKTFYAQVDASSTTIWANFGSDPTSHLVEINVRQSAIKPDTLGLAFITIDGFHIAHGATQWSPPTAEQYGLVDLMQGHHWLIQNNTVTDSRTVGIMCGTHNGGLGSGDINTNGNHVVRKNTIQRCGEAGIAGENRWPASLIENNLIEDINWAQQFGGFETAGIKIHDANDVVIKNNIIHGVQTGGNGQHQGIWLDWAGQGSRVTGNIFYDIHGEVLDFEMDHGPQLADNNIIVGNKYSGVIWEAAENGVFVHNLFVDSTWSGSQKDSRSSGYVVPHTLKNAGSKTQDAADDRYLNNIYVGGGTQTIPVYQGYQIDYNVFYDNAKKHDTEDVNSIFKPSFHAYYKLDVVASGVQITFVTDTAPRDVAAPLITRDYIGINTTTGQGIENHDGTPITVDTDIFGAARDKTHPSAGPFENLPTTRAQYVFLAGAGATVWGAAPGSIEGGVPSAGSGGTKTGAGGSATNKDGGSPGAGGAGTAGSTDVPAGGDDDEVIPGESKSGCGCRTGGRETSAHGAAWLALAGLVVALRRRRTA